MKRSTRVANSLVALCALVSPCFIAVPVRAIGPQDQLINPTFDGVVRMLDNRPGGGQAMGDGYMSGTGSIIGHELFEDGQGCLCVLTADHVVSSTGTRAGALVNEPGIAFGNSALNSGNSPYIKALPKVRRHGFNGTTDYAVLGVKYGPYDADYDALVRTLVPASAFFYFSDIGYGNEGQLVNQFAGAPNPDGYQSQGRYGTQRYLNDKIGVFNGSGTFSPFGGYVYDDAALWYIDDPNGVEDQDGSGTTYDADSGSPYFSTEPAFDDVNNIYYYTNNQFAVHTGTDTSSNPPGSPAGYKAFGVENYGVALTQNDINWITRSCSMMVPEPSSLTLLLTALVAVFRRRRR
jgi:hypothetical protein